jgi:hypothetical protein
MDSYVVRSNEIAWRVYDGEAVLMSDDGTQIHTLNQVSTLIWELADGSNSIKDMVVRICDRFEVAEDEATADVSEFIGQLLDMDLVSVEDTATRKGDEKK